MEDQKDKAGESAPKSPPRVVTCKDIMERLATAMVKKETTPPAVSVSVVENMAKRMMAFGYEFTEDTVNVLADYLKGYNLWLCGNVGVGKTFFFDCVNKVRLQRGLGGIVKLSMIETQGWTMETARDWADDCRGCDVLIDDVGTEPLMKSWGQEAELFPYLLEKRMQLSGNRTHLTSNLGILDFKRRYGERVSDRFVQMFKMKVMKAKKSRRVLRPWKRSGNGNGVL